MSNVTQKMVERRSELLTDLENRLHDFESKRYRHVVAISYLKRLIASLDTLKIQTLSDFHQHQHQLVNFLNDEMVFLKHKKLYADEVLNLDKSLRQFLAQFVSLSILKQKELKQADRQPAVDSPIVDQVDKPTVAKVAFFNQCYQLKYEQAFFKNAAPHTMHAKLARNQIHSIADVEAHVKAKKSSHSARILQTITPALDTITGENSAEEKLAKFKAAYTLQMQSESFSFFKKWVSKMHTKVQGDTLTWDEVQAFAKDAKNQETRTVQVLKKIGLGA